MTPEQTKDLKAELREAAWTVVRNSALYKDQLLSNEECDDKADELAEKWFADGVVWIVDQEVTLIEKREAERRAA